MRGRLAGMGAGEWSSQKSELIGFYEGLRKKKLKTKKKEMDFKTSNAEL